MGQLERSVELYRLMAERCERNGLSPNQAKVYGEMTDFISNCGTIEEATTAIRNSEYYLAPTEALVRDKIEAKAKAASEKDMPDVAEVYEKKLKAIDTDQGEMYTAGYEQTALNIRKDYILTIQAFGEIFSSYICYKTKGDNTYLNEINYNLGQLKRPSSDFFVLAEIGTFRDLITCTDKGYQEFIDDMKQVVAGNSEAIKLPYEGDEPDAAWESIKELKNEIREAGKGFRGFDPKPEVIATGTKEGYIYE